MARRSQGHGILALTDQLVLLINSVRKRQKPPADGYPTLIGSQLPYNSLEKQGQLHSLHQQLSAGCATNLVLKAQ